MAKLDLEPIDNTTKLDLEPFDAPAPKKSAGFLPTLEQSILNIGGGAERGLGELGTESSGRPEMLSALAKVTGGEAPTQQQVYGGIPKAPFAQPSSFGYKAAEFAGHHAPDIMGAYGLGKGALALAAKPLAKFSGKVAEETGANFINKLMGKTSFSKAHIPVLADIRKSFRTARDTARGEYKNILSDAENLGYSKSVTKAIPGISIAGKGSKFVNSPLFSGFEDDITPTTKKLKNALSSFKDNPSLGNAHGLQSALGSEGSSLSSSADGAMRLQGGQLGLARNALKNDITNTLDKYGDGDISKRYGNASDFYKSNVAPYLENALTRKVALRKGLKEVNPESILNALKKDDASTNIIKNNLSDRSRNILLGNALKTAVRQTPKGKRIVNPLKLLAAHSNLDNKGLNEFITPESSDVMNTIENQLSTSEKLKKTAKRATWLASLLGGTEVLRRNL